jgi:antitoxin VapB
MESAKVFQNGRSQAIRLPKEFRFNSDEVYVKKQGNIVLLIPKNDPYQSFVESLDSFTDDFMKVRNQPKQQKRKPIS